MRAWAPVLVAVLLAGAVPFSTSAVAAQPSGGEASATAGPASPAGAVAPAEVPAPPASARGAAKAPQPAEPPSAEAHRTLVVANRPVVTFRTSVGGSDPEERLHSAEDRLARLPYGALLDPVTTQPASYGGQRGLAVLVGKRLAFFVGQGDEDALVGQSLEELGDATAERLAGALRAQHDQRDVPTLLWGIGQAALATAVLAALIWLLARARRLVALGVESVAERRTVRLAQRGIDLGPVVHATTRALMFVLFWALVALLLDLWVTFVLGRFPLTAPWAVLLTGQIVGLLGDLGLAVLRSIPDLIAVAAILLAGRFLARFLDGLLDRVERGALKLPGVYPETVAATRRLVAALVWLIALAAAYPYIPGSGSEAVKGLSLLVGVMLSLGSTGLVSQAMSGLAVIYSRALAAGDTVRIGEIEGVVSEVGLLSTKVVTLPGQEVTIPNSVVIAGAVKNFTRLAGGGGPFVTTTATIGYDAPWRQVEALLLQAAGETAGLRRDPPPFVLQRGLDDFYVQYELVARLAGDPLERPRVLSELHGHVQDAFNAAGVQILSPHFALQPREPVVVPRDRWHAPPASPEPAPPGPDAQGRERG